MCGGDHIGMESSWGEITPDTYADIFGESYTGDWGQSILPTKVRERRNYSDRTPSWELHYSPLRIQERQRLYYDTKHSHGILAISTREMVGSSMVDENATAFRSLLCDRTIGIGLISGIYIQ